MEPPHPQPGRTSAVRRRGAGRWCGNILAVPVDALRERLLSVAARMPRTHRVLRAVARWRAGRHHVAAVAVIVDDDVVLVAEHPFRGGVWALPGGWVNRREDPFRAVEREVREELALDVTAVEIVHCERQGTDPPGGPPALTLAFRCRLLTSGRPDAVVHSGELRNARWIDVSATGSYLTGFEQEAVLATRRAIRSATPTPPASA